MNSYTITIAISILISFIFAIVHIIQGVALNGSALMMILFGVVIPLAAANIKESADNHAKVNTVS